MAGPHRLVVPLTDILLSGDEVMYQCEACGWSGDRVTQKHEGRTGSITIIICPRCGNSRRFDEILTLEYRLIPKEASR